jgi:hypothetical protein
MNFFTAVNNAAKAPPPPTGFITNNLFSHFDIGNGSYINSGHIDDLVYTCISGINLRLEIQGAVYSSEGGGSLYFDGVNDRCRHDFNYEGYYNGQQTEQRTGVSLLGDMTLGLWIRTLNLSATQFVYSFQNSLTDGLNFYISALNNGRYVGRVNSTLSVKEVPNTTDFFYVTTTYSDANNTLSLYINGVLEHTLTITTSFDVFKEYIVLGGDSRGLTDASRFFWNGYLSQAQLYKSTLTSAQVLQNFEAQKDRYGY